MAKGPKKQSFFAEHAERTRNSPEPTKYSPRTSNETRRIFHKLYGTERKTGFAEHEAVEKKKGLGPTAYCPSPARKIMGHYNCLDRYTTAEEVMKTGNAVNVPPCNAYKLPDLVSNSINSLVQSRLYVL